MSGDGYNDLDMIRRDLAMQTLVLCAISRRLGEDGVAELANLAIAEATETLKDLEARAIIRIDEGRSLPRVSLSRQAP